MALQDEIDAYETLRPQLEATELGRWALVHEQKLEGVFDDFDTAASDAVKRFGRGPYLIRQIGAGSVTLPASVMYNMRNGNGTLRV